MEEKVKIDRLVTHVKEYAEERLNLIILNLYDKVSAVIANTASYLILGALGIFTVVFLSTGLAWWIGIQLESPFLGFVIVGGIYLLAAILIYVNRAAWIQKPIINSFIKNVTDEN